jgi:hypothetical protein
MSRRPHPLRAWLREPLVQFVLIGALLFLVFEWRGQGPESGRIVITPGQVDSLAASFTRVWQRPPTETELKGLVDDYVREEIAVREAEGMGLDSGDTVIRRRLRQKFEFLAEDAIASVPPTDEELQTWLDERQEQFRTEPQVALRQVYLDPDRHGNALESEASRLLARLREAGTDVEVDSLGDSLMLPSAVSLSPKSAIARQFGERFANAVLELQPGRWDGPVRSGYGWHLVLVTGREDGSLPPLEEIRPLVERELMAERRTKGLEAMYERLLDRYRVTIEGREAVTPSSTEASAESSR